MLYTVQAVRKINGYFHFKILVTRKFQLYSVYPCMKEEEKYPKCMPKSEYHKIFIEPVKGCK
jgi:hypothetical protein